MTNTARTVDDAIFDTPRIGLQKLASCVEYYSNLSPKVFGRIMFMLGGAISVTYTLGQYQILHEVKDLRQLVLHCLVMIVFFIRVERVSNRVKLRATRNALRASPAEMYLRLYFITGTVVFSLLIPPANSAISIGLILLHYFIACDSLPPHMRFQWRKINTQRA